jgi:hypothetical protein
LVQMKPYRKIIVGCCWVALLFLLTDCAAPQRFWPQEDIIGSETTAPDGKQVILIASRSSDFKKLLVAKLHEQLAAEGLAQKTIGIKDLPQINASEYAVVVVINTCLAWGLDSDVQVFLDHQKTDENIIVLTTSGNGAWLPDKGGRNFDAISAASKMTSVDTAVRDVMDGINTRLQSRGAKPKPVRL